jgi:hypothetical protein
MAYTGCNEKGEWGLALSSAAQGSLIDIVGASFFFVVQGCGPNDLLSVTDAVGVGRVATNGHCHGESNSNSKMQGVRNLGAEGLVGNPVSAGNFALQLDGCGNGRSRSASRADDGDRSCSRTRGGEAKEEEHEPGGSQEEVLMVAKQKWQGGATRPPH